MSTYEQRDNAGAIFRNDRKKSEKHPDWSGTVRINGHDYWCDGWTKQGRSGEFFSLSFKQKDGSAPPSRGGSTPKQGQQTVGDILDDSCPF